MYILKLVYIREHQSHKKIYPQEKREARSVVFGDTATLPVSIIFRDPDP